MDYYVTNIEEQRTDTDTKAVIFVRDSEGTPDRLTVRGLNPYFYAPTAEVKAREEDLLYNGRVRYVSHGDESLFGEPVSKIEVRTRDDVKELAATFEQTFEADVWYSNRARIDLDIYTGVSSAKKNPHFRDIEPCDVEVPLRINTFDIETDDRGDFPEPGEKQILSIVTHDSYRDEYVGFIQTGGRSIADVLPNGKPDGFDRVDFFAEEKAMLEGFVDYIAETDPDVLTGWNFTDFDAPYVVARLSKLGINPSRLSRMDYAGLNRRGEARIMGRIVYDMMDAYASAQQNELESYRLNAIAERELGENKVDHTGQGIYEMWEDDCEKLLHYNLVDVQLVVEIDQTAGILEFRQTLAHQVGVGLDGTGANNQFIGMLVRRKLREWNKVAPTAVYADSWEKYDGAYVLDAYYGVARNVLGMDLASLYPYTMAMLNASPECRVDESFDGPVSRAPNGARFRLDKEGLFTALVNEAIGLKSDYKTEKLACAANSAEEKLAAVRYNVAKTITNSLYGTIGWARFFLYDEPTAEAVTTTGQVVIKKTQGFLNDAAHSEVIYGDTDSNYVKFPDEWSQERCIAAAHALAEELNNGVYPELAGEWGMADRECLWDIEVESYAPVFFQAGKKKRYAQRVTWKDGKDTDEVKIKGFDTERSDTAPLTNDIQKEILESIVRGVPTGELSSIVYKYSQALSDPETDLAYIAIPQGIGKELDEYDVPGAHVRGATYANKIMGTNFEKGSKPRRLYIVPTHFEETGATDVDVLCFEESADLPADIAPDVPMLTEKLIERPVGPILDAVGVSTAAAVRGQTQTGLSNWV